ncbi:hypothetical protein E4U43_007777 [Claviceps pusilla]|uniref:Uncharacterized protein n=1 Tax=Claviceps pusilla TaxID=123648 RepID=A0A9P7T0A3_9HYPO|nr:hypothetical protein E4U43_007777 [Claviceps pusilla]
MAITVAPYSSEVFNRIPIFGDALPKFDRLNGDEIAKNQMREVFRRHKVEHVLGLALVHKHSFLEEGERLTDVRGTSNPLNFAAGRPSVLKFSDDGQQLAPLEFSLDQQEIDWQDPNMQEFLAEFFQIVKQMDAVNLFGLCGYPGDGYPGRVEFSSGRSNVNLTPDEARRYLPDIGFSTREAAWFYTENLEESGCHCSCYTRATQEHGHVTTPCSR